MYTFRELQRAKGKAVEGKEFRLAVLGNCATQFLSTAIEGYGKLSGLQVCVYDAPYDQIDAQLLDPASEVYRFKADAILLYLASEVLYEAFLREELSAREQFAELLMQKLKRYWAWICKNAGTRILQMGFAEIDDKALGHFSCKTQSAFIFQIRKLNVLLQEAASNESAVYPVDLTALQIDLGRDAFFQAKLYYEAKMTLSLAALPYVAGAVIRVVESMCGRINKCLILDLDNTLWGGIISEDGLNGIEIGTLGRGHCFSNLQSWIRQLKDYGIILAVCSKNDEWIAKEPFKKHEEMVLHLSDIAIFVANWEDKATNIKRIQEGLNIGMDSIVFLDDDPFERELVRSRLPGIEVPELPEDPALWLAFLQRQNYFDTVSYTGAGSDRTKLYQAEFERQQFSSQFGSLEEYLSSLKMEGRVTPFLPEQYARIAQLTQRSNQFNLRTIRYTENEICRIAEDPDCITLAFSLKDRFGAHGLVAVAILRSLPEQALFVDTFLISCRVLKRGMEEFALNAMVRAAKQRGCRTITGEYIPTAKNAMVAGFYQRMGFTLDGENRWRLELSSYQEMETKIQEEMQNV